MTKSIMYSGHGSLKRTPGENAVEGRNLGRVKEPPLFGQMFPTLADNPHDASDAALEALGKAMIDNNVNPSGDAAAIPAGFTYLGQFIDHDMTLDKTSIKDVIDDPLSVRNFRTPALDLDSLYSGGPGDTKFLYKRDKSESAKFIIGESFASSGVPDLPNDLPRNKEGIAIIGDHRNDENLLVAQTHLAFLKFHNKVVDHLVAARPILKGDELFLEARRIVTWHYQWIVLFDFVERLVGKGMIAKIKKQGRKIYRFREDGRPFMPVEFASAIYRLGHSMVRQKYSHNRIFVDQPFSDFFSFSGLSGNIGIGFDTLPSNWIIDWRRFHEVESSNPNDVPLNMSRKLDPLLAPELHTLPNGANLAVLNLLRGKARKLPSGQDVAAFMKKHVNEPVLTPDEIATGPDGAVAKQHGLHTSTPLWYYILKEAQVRNNGDMMGPYGGRMLAEVFLGIIAGDKTSFIRDENEFNGKWSPEKEANPLPAETAGTFTMADMLRFIDDINPVG